MSASVLGAEGEDRRGREGEGDEGETRASCVLWGVLFAYSEFSMAGTY